MRPLEEHVLEVVDYATRREQKLVWDYWPQKYRQTLAKAWAERQKGVLDALHSGDIQKDIDRAIGVRDDWGGFSEDEATPDFHKSLLYQFLMSRKIVGTNYTMAYCQILEKELLSLMGIGPRRIKVMILSPYPSWGHMLTAVMEDADEAMIRMSRESYLHGTTWTRTSLRSLREWASPWYPGPAPDVELPTEWWTERVA
jgi:hypothetical protein